MIKISPHTSIKGFTLVELSIVIVIIGLIVAGIMAGKSLVKQAQIQGMLNEASQYKAAIMAFKLQYNYLPGDIPNAGSYWPSCYTTPANCNGNGDRAVNHANGGPNSVESIRAWQQLAMAGLIKGTYTGLGYSCGNRTQTPGLNVPTTVFKDSTSGYPAGWMFWTYSLDNNRTNLSVGSNSNNCWANYWPLFTPAQAYVIDAKIDDGIPRSGQVTGRYGWDAAIPPASETSCQSGSYDMKTPGVYNLATTGVACMLFFWVQ